MKSLRYALLWLLNGIISVKRKPATVRCSLGSLCIVWNWRSSAVGGLTSLILSWQTGMVTSVSSREEGYNISEEQSLHVNVRNVRDIVDEYLIDDYNRAPLPSETGASGLDKAYYGRQIYVRKAERLYYQIRLTPDTGNFANFVVPVVNAGATYCRRKCFRTVLGRKCRFVKQPSAVKCCNTFLGRKREKSAL